MQGEWRPLYSYQERRPLSVYSYLQTWKGILLLLFSLVFYFAVGGIVGMLVSAGVFILIFSRLLTPRVDDLRTNIMHILKKKRLEKERRKWQKYCSC